MVDLQRPISGIWNIVLAEIQACIQNSDAALSNESVLSEKFSGRNLNENFIRVN
jgi:hypothetical protein